MLYFTASSTEEVWGNHDFNNSKTSPPFSSVSKCHCLLKQPRLLGKMSDHRIKRRGGVRGKYIISLNHLVPERKVFRDDETGSMYDSVIPSLSIPKGNENMSTQRLVHECVQQYYS